MFEPRIDRRFILGVSGLHSKVVMNEVGRHEYLLDFREWTTIQIDNPNNTGDEANLSHCVNRLNSYPPMDQINPTVLKMDSKTSSHPSPKRAVRVASCSGYKGSSVPILQSFYFVLVMSAIY